MLPKFRKTIADFITCSARTAAAFGAVGGAVVLYFLADVPRIRKDIMQKIPLLGDYFVKEIPPEDNPF